MQSAAEIPALYNLEDAARSLGRISSWTLRRHLRRGTLSAVRIGRRLLISSNEIRRIQAQGLPSLAESQQLVATQPHA